MNTESIIHAFEITVCNSIKPMPMIAVGQSMNTLISGDVLRVNACSKKTAYTVKEYCSNIGHTLLQDVEIDDEVTLYIRKN